jgi:hypothetical protein
MEGNMSFEVSEYVNNGVIVGLVLLLFGIILFVWGMSVGGRGPFMQGVVTRFI